MTVYFFSSLVLCFILQLLYIKKLSRLSLFRREDYVDPNKKACIQELHKHKNNTPSMGGMAIAVCFLVMTIVSYIIDGEMYWSTWILILFAVLGFVDDIEKLKRVRDGITAKEKFIALVLISIILTMFSWDQGLIGDTIFRIPFIPIEFSWNTTIYLAMVVFMMVLTCNSVNITDGLDGLALGISSMAYVVILIIAAQQGVKDVVFGSVILLSACLATLIFNHYPAKVFMGDTGALLLGGTIAFYMVRLGLPIWLLLLLAVCMWEVLSVVIQLTSIRFRHEKVFLIAPFHHHLEKKGWKEITIVRVFWAISAVMCGVTYLAYIIMPK